MSELTDALAYWDRTEHPPMPAVDPFVKAARLVANPNIEAFLAALWAHGTDVLNWDQRQGIERAATLALTAALTPRDE